MAYDITLVAVCDKCHIELGFHSHEQAATLVSLSELMIRHGWTVDLVDNEYYVRCGICSLHASIADLEE